jgi:hypothetical protein
MDRGSKKRRLTGFAKPQPNTLGKMWQQQTSQGDQQTDNRLMDEQRERGSRDERGSRLSDWQALPPLPKWPPLPEEDPFTQDTMQATELQPAVQWEQSAPSQSDHPDHKLQRLWQSIVSDTRRRWIALATVAGVVVLCSLLSVAALGNLFRASSPFGGSGTPPAGSANGNTASTAGLSTPTASASPSPAATFPADTALTIAFTCASGVVGEKGTVCVHTEPNATLTITVRYCDGNYAGGKGLRGIAHADSNGNYTWRWDVSTSCVGATTAEVTAKSGGQTVTQSTTFNITN